LENTTLDQVFRNVRTDVLQASNDLQRPIESSQLTGQAFYLVKSNYEKVFGFVERVLNKFNNPYFDETDYNPQLFECLAKLNLIISGDSKNIRALLLVAMVYDQLEQYDQAMSYVNFALEIDNKYVAAYQFRSELYPIGDIRAIEDINKAIELDPQDILNFHWKIAQYVEDDKFNQALLAVDEALILHSKEADLYRQKAMIHWFLLQNKLALKYYSKAIELDPENGFGYVQKADFLRFELDKNEEALKLYEKAHNLKPDEASPLYGMIYSYFALNELDSIKNLCEKLISLDFKDPEPYYHLSNYYRLSNNYLKSATYLSIAIFKILEDKNYDYSIFDKEGSEAYVFDLYLDRSILYKALSIDILECTDLNNALRTISEYQYLSEKELLDKEFYEDEEYLLKMYNDIEKLISQRCISNN
ncbi:hypothetical protein N8301_06075, partial [Cyclobacteriaceae bacterium]|nr:hypothetical protein [Cyclobacteriaceae bacterium]